jgi:hypothetical protein
MCLGLGSHLFSIIKKSKRNSENLKTYLKSPGNFMIGIYFVKKLALFNFSFLDPKCATKYETLKKSLNLVQNGLMFIHNY